MLHKPDKATVLGLMSGTSCDGLDMAILEFGRGQRWRFIRSAEQSFDVELRERLLAASDSRTADLARLRFDFMRWCGDEVAKFLDGESVDLVVSHGQTIFHEPPRATWQLGDGNVLAVACGYPVLWNLRSADVAAGGQGAPLVPVPDQFFFTPVDGARWLLNIGGIANLTLLVADQSGWAGDVGPGNCWVDRWVASRSGGSLAMDANGSVSRSGQVDEALLQNLLGAVEPFLGQSLARETFSVDWLMDLVPEQVKTADGARTLIELTVTLIARAIGEHPSQATEIFVAGGGAHNPVMMDSLTQRLPDLTVSAFEQLGMPGDAREAACFACLGWLYLCKKSGADPSVTGAKKPKLLGSLALP